MTRAILDDVNLLKKYHHNLIVDYTEYPTKGEWSEETGSDDYKAALREWVTQYGNNPSLFYVHTPFCEELCYFCLCSKEITRNYENVKDYLYDYLFKEIDLLKAEFSKIGVRPNFKEIYFGGGSPTYYKEKEFADLINKLKEVIDFDGIETFTVEIDPRRVDVDKLKFYHTQGVNRLSFGIQDFDPKVQEEINRIQPPELLHTLLTPEIRELFPISFDILVGLPAQTAESMRKTIETVCELRPDQVEPLYVHYKPGTRSYMTRMVRNVPMADFYERREIYVEVIEGLLKGGYSRAGFENFALPENVLAERIDSGDAVYNSLGTVTGDAMNFFAVGSSAHGALGDDFYFQNYYEQNLYREALDRDEFPVYRGFRLSNEDKIRRDFIKTIRTYFSVDYAKFGAKHGIDFKQHFAPELETLKEFEKDGLVVLSEDALSLTEVGQHFCPNVASVFDQYLDRDHYRNEITTLRDRASVEVANAGSHEGDLLPVAKSETPSTAWRRSTDH